MNRAKTKWMPAPDAVVDEYLLNFEKIVDRVDRSYDMLESTFNAALEPNTKSREIVIRLTKSIQNGIALSAIRVNDGEGNILSVGSPICPLSVWEFNANKIIKMMFASDGGAASDFHVHRGMLIKAINDADIIGIPPRKRALASLSKARLKQDLRGMAGVHQVAQELVRGVQTGEVDLTDKCIVSGHFSREIDSYYKEIVAGQDSASYIGCYDEIPPILCKDLALRNVFHYKLPQQPSNVGVRKFKSARHYSDIFPKILEELNVSRRGECFFVSAGLLGKAYCSRIKSLGGVAIDIGSLADAWVGNPVRPFIHTDRDTYSRL